MLKPKMTKITFQHVSPEHKEQWTDVSVEDYDQQRRVYISTTSSVVRDSTRCFEFLPEEIYKIVDYIKEICKIHDGESKKELDETPPE